tara:strand:+ start:872 stop:1273 length:402 start_codon:yes stop_codon:yes gene_type:complete
MSDYREQIRQGLLDSYKHRVESNCGCAVCGNTTKPLAFHMLETAFNEADALPSIFTAMSSSRGRIRGSYPICNSCAPACKKCQLPIPTEKVMELGHKLSAHTGSGICKDIKFGLLFSALFKRLFKIGRFGNKT